MFPKQFLSKHIYFSRLNDSWKLSTTQHLWDFFATTFLFFIIHSEKRWRRKQHQQINHIKNISSSNYISIRIIQNITHKVDINEMRKNRNKKIESFFFCLFLLTLCKTRFVQLSIFKVMTAMDRKRKLIYRSIIVCTLLETKKIILWWLKFFFHYQISCSK